MSAHETETGTKAQETAIRLPKYKTSTKANGQVLDGKIFRSMKEEENQGRAVGVREGAFGTGVMVDLSCSGQVVEKVALPAH